MHLIATSSAELLALRPGPKLDGAVIPTGINPVITNSPKVSKITYAYLSAGVPALSGLKELKVILILEISIKKY